MILHIVRADLHLNEVLLSGIVGNLFPQATLHAQACALRSGRHITTLMSIQFIMLLC